MKFNQKYYLEKEFLEEFAIDPNLSNIEVKCKSIVSKDRMKYIILIKSLNMKFNAFLVKDDGEPYFIINRKFLPIKSIKIKKKLIDLIDPLDGY